MCAWPRVRVRLERGERIADFDSAGPAGNSHPVEASVTISPVRGADGRVAGASVVARDIGERKAAEEKTGLLLGELDHRVKNILAIVSAVVSQTLKAGLAPEAFAAAVEGRIRAIAAAHSLLTETGRGEMSLRALVTTELAPYDRGGGRPGHHRPRRRADAAGRAGAGDPRARQQCGQVWRALDALRSAGGGVEDHRRRGQPQAGAGLDGNRRPGGAAAGAARVRDNADRAGPGP